MESIESLIDALEDYEGTALVVTHDEELLHAFATRLVVFDGGKCRIFEGTYADFLEKVGWASEKKPGGSESANIKVSNIDVKGDADSSASTSNASAAPRAKEDRKARADYIAERSKVIKPLEKKLAKIEEDIAKAEALGGELEAKLVTASESGDGYFSSITFKGNAFNNRYRILLIFLFSVLSGEKSTMNKMNL